MQSEIAEWLIGFLPDGIAQKIAAGNGNGLLDIALKEKFSDFGQMIMRTCTVVIVRKTFPERVFVELNPFIKHAAENHGTYPAVADRQSVRPFFSWFGIPQAQRIGRGILSETSW